MSRSSRTIPPAPLPAHLPHASESPVSGVGYEACANQLNATQLPSVKRDPAGLQADLEEERRLSARRQLALQAQSTEAQARAKVLPPRSRLKCIHQPRLHSPSYHHSTSCWTPSPKVLSSIPNVHDVPVGIIEQDAYMPGFRHSMVPNRALYNTKASLVLRSASTLNF